MKLAILFASVALVTAAPPTARHMAIEITPATDKLIRLDVDVTGIAAHNCTITAIPLIGTLYQLSDNYMNFQYNPWKGLAISGAETVRVGTNCTIVYEAPLDFSVTRFEYRVDTSGGNSAVGIVDLVKADRILQYSNFTFNKESWKVMSTVTKDVCWSSTAITGNLNHYVYNCNMEKTLQMKNDNKWYFYAPAAWHRNLVTAFNGTITFNLAGFEGYFTSDMLYGTPSTFIYIGCSTCASGAGKYIAQRNITFDGTASSYTFRLNENPYNGWRADPFDIERTEWPLTTDCDIVDILAGLDTIRIYGDVSMSEEIVGFDDFVVSVGPSETFHTCYP